MLVRVFKQQRFLLLPVDAQLHVILHAAAAGKDTVHAMLAATLLQSRLLERSSDLASLSPAEFEAVVTEALHKSTSMLPSLLEQLGASPWNAQHFHIHTRDTTRVTW